MSKFLIIFCSLFDFCCVPKYVSESRFINVRTNQIAADIAVLDELYKSGIDRTQELRLEYFFYTNSANKAKNLCGVLKKMDYEALYRRSASNNKEYLVTGRTTPVLTQEKEVVLWARNMCEIGYRYDCDFDGWGVEVK